MEAYCVKCKAKREMEAPSPVFLRNGQPATQGTCAVCGTKLTRLGRTDEHAALPPPEIRSTGKGSLVIVESPAKARTLKKLLGKAYRVKPSVGHIRDLPSRQMGVDLENDFRPRYVIPTKKADVVRDLKKDARAAAEIYLATDPDREGEAIAWHLTKALANSIQGKPTRRVVFHEITKNAVQEAFARPRDIDETLVDAQQARRILDRIVGYTLSPLLREKLGRSRLSAGRVLRPAFAFLGPTSRLGQHTRGMELAQPKRRYLRQSLAWPAWRRRAPARGRKRLARPLPEAASHS